MVFAGGMFFAVYTFNRTIVELKRSSDFPSADFLMSFNRTIVELKQTHVASYYPVSHSF